MVFFIPICSQACQSPRAPLARGTPQEKSALWLGLPALVKANRSTTSQGPKPEEALRDASGGRPIPGDSSTALPTHLSHPENWEEQRRAEALHYPSGGRGGGQAQCGEDRMETHSWGEHVGWQEDLLGGILVGRLRVPGQSEGITKPKLWMDGVVSCQQRGHLCLQGVGLNQMRTESSADPSSYRLFAAQDEYFWTLSMGCGHREDPGQPTMWVPSDPAPIPSLKAKIRVWITDGSCEEGLEEFSVWLSTCGKDWTWILKPRSSKIFSSVWCFKAHFISFFFFLPMLHFAMFNIANFKHV